MLPLSDSPFLVRLGRWVGGGGGGGVGWWWEWGGGEWGL